MQRLEVKKPNEIHQKNFPWQYFVVVYETPNCDFFFFLVKNTVSEQKTKSNGNLLNLVLKSLFCAITPKQEINPLIFKPRCPCLRNLSLLYVSV